MTSAEIAAELSMTSARVRDVLASIRRMKMLASDHSIPGVVRFTLTREPAPMPRLPALSKKPGETLIGSIASASGPASVVYPEGYKKTVSSSSYRPLEGYRLRDGIRDGSSSYRLHGSRVGDSVRAYTGQIVTMLGGGEK